jgi:hypothetical protein
MLQAAKVPLLAENKRSRRFNAYSHSELLAGPLATGARKINHSTAT